jgi:hypothetical protein
MELLGRWPARAFTLVLAWFWFASFTRQANAKRAFAVAVRQGVAILDQANRTRLPIAFQSIHFMYPFVGDNWMRDSSAMFLDLSDSTFDAIIPAPYRAHWFAKALRVERDFARVHSRRFGFPRLVTQQFLDTASRFLLYAPARLPPGLGNVESFGRALFPHHTVIGTLPELYLFQRQPAPK